MKSRGEIAFEKAVAQASDLRSRIEHTESTIAAMHQQIKADTAELRKLERFIASAYALAEDAPRPTRVKNPNRREVASKALELIHAARRPLNRRELYERLLQAGVSLNGKDAEMVLGTMLYRDERIVRIRGHGYWPKGEAYDPAFYIPEHEAIIGVTDNSRPPDDD